MNFRTTTFPEVSMGTDAYDDEEESKEDNHYRMAQELVHGSCHVKQVHDLGCGSSSCQQVPERRRVIWLHWMLSNR
jgi:phosphomevalonate kinase